MSRNSFGCSLQEFKIKNEIVEFMLHVDDKQGIAAQGLNALTRFGGVRHVVDGHGSTPSCHFGLAAVAGLPCRKLVEFFISHAAFLAPPSNRRFLWNTKE